MANHSFSGTGVAIVTPFQQNGAIDFSALEKLVEHQINGGINYIVVLGTTGEGSTLSKEEKKQIFSAVNQFTKGRISLVAGIGGNDTQGVIDSFSSYDLTGYNGILSVSPYYNKPNDEGLYQHFKAIGAASPLPIIMYNVPGRTGMNVNTATTLRIARDCKNIIATKEASGNMEQIMQIIKDKPVGFEVISGDDGITLPLIACGAIGVISVLANAYPRQLSTMVKFCLEDDFAGARPIHEKLMPIIHSLFAEGNPSGIKAYLSEMGIVDEYFRLPVVGVGDQLKNEIKSLMQVL
jgi:4-hydroxy-tetrahydrodipicolinate synthase